MFTVLRLCHNNLATSSSTSRYNTFCLWNHHVNLLLQNVIIYVVFPQTKSVIYFIAMQSYKELIKPLQVCLNKPGQAVRTHPVDKLLEQHCYKSAAGLLQLVRFYVCTTRVKTHKLLQICKQVVTQVCSQAVNKLFSHCLFPVVVTSL